MPDLRSGDEARAYVSELRSILVAVGASDGKMEEGSLRVDCNVSVRRRGAPEFGTRCEIKNVNSLRSLGRAIDYEAARQVDLIEAGERVRAADPALERGRGPHHVAAHQGGRERLPLLPRARPGGAGPRRPSGSSGSAPRCPILPAARRHRLADAAGATLRQTALHRRARPGRPVPRRHRRRAPTRPARSPTPSTTCPTTGRAARPGGVRRAGRTRGRRRADGHPGQAGARRDGRHRPADRRTSPPSTASRPWRRPSSRGWSTA